MRGVGCAFCERLHGEAKFPGGVLTLDPLFHSTLWTAGEGRPYLGQIVIQTRRHVPSLGELSAEEGAALGPLVQQLAAALQKVVRPELIYLDCYMEGVRHVHLFLTPRYPGTPSEFWRLKVTDWEGAPHGDLAELQTLGDRLRGALGPSRPIQLGSGRPDPAS